MFLLLHVRGLPSFLPALSYFQAAQGWTSCFGNWGPLKRPTERAPQRLVRVNLGLQTPPKGATLAESNVSSAAERSLWGSFSLGFGEF